MSLVGALLGSYRITDELSSAARAARARRRGEGAARGADVGRRARRSVLHRSARGDRDSPSEHHRGVRLRVHRDRRGVPRHGVPRGRVAARVLEAVQAGGLAAATGRAVRARARERAGRRAREGHRPPRSQTREHLPRARCGAAVRRARQDPRLRDREARRSDGPADRPQPHDRRRVDRHAALHGARAGALGEGDRSPRGSVLARLHPLRDGRRRGPLSEGRIRRGDRDAPVRSATAAARSRAGSRAGARRCACARTFARAGEDGGDASRTRAGSAGDFAYAYAYAYDAPRDATHTRGCESSPEAAGVRSSRWRAHVEVRTDRDHAVKHPLADCLLFAAHAVAAQPVTTPAEVPPLAQIHDDQQLAEILTAITQDPAVKVDDPKARAVAQALMTEGVHRLQIQAYAQALANFLEAYTRFPSPRILLNIASTLNAMGRAADAANTYQRYLSAPATGAERVAEVKELLIKLDAQLTLLTVHVTPHGSEVSIDAGPFVPGGSSLQTRVRPGTHTLRLRRGSAINADDLNSFEGEPRDVTLEVKPEPQAPTAAAPPPSAAKPPEQVAGWLVDGRTYGPVDASSRQRRVQDDVTGAALK